MSQKSPNTSPKKHWGDRFDATRVRGEVSMKYVMPVITPRRTDNEGYVYENFDLTQIDKYVEEKNALIAAGSPDGNPKNNPNDIPYTTFHVILSAFMKTVVLRPQLNWFIQNKRLYKRDQISASFIIRKRMTADGGNEGLARILVDENTVISDIHESIRRQVLQSRQGEEASDATMEQMDVYGSMPSWLLVLAGGFVAMLERHGMAPRAVTATDPFQGTVLFSNVGSVGMKGGYHHLTEWGTTSIFCMMGKKEIRPIFQEDGSWVMRNTVDLGLTIDERIADGFYFSKSIRLFRKIIENPWILDEPFGKEIEY